MRSLLVTFVILISIQFSYSQNQDLNPLWFQNTSALNPSETGQEHNHYINVNTEFTPVNSNLFSSNRSLTYEKQLKNPNFGIGINFLDEKIGPSKNSLIKLNISHRIEFSEKSHLSFGSSIGSYIQTIESNRTNELRMGIGVSYTKGGLKLGFARKNNSPTSFNGDYDIKVNQNSFLSSSYEFIVSKNLKIEPQIIALLDKYSPVSPLFLVKSEYKGKYILGVSGEYNESCSAFAGLNFSKFSLTYAITVPTSKLLSNKSSKHQASLSFFIRD